MSQRLKAIGAAVAAVIAMVIGAWVVLGHGDPEPAAVANLWLDSNGGSCTRHAAPAPYRSAEACRSLQAAWRQAKPGDEVLVRTGRYAGAGNRLARRPGAAPPNVIMRPAEHERVVLEELTLEGASYVTIQGFRIEPDHAVADNNDKVIDVGAFAHDVVLDRISLDLLDEVRDGVGISGGVDRLQIRDSELCCNAGNGGGAGGKLVQIQNAGDAFGTNTNITLDGNRLHTNVQGAVDDHMECLYIAAVTQLTLSRNHFHDCALNTIEGAFGSVPQTDWRIENNVFEHADGGVRGVPLDLTACNARSNWIVQYNYFAQGMDACDNTGVTIRGNIGRSGGCRAGAVYEYNVWADAKCSPTDVQASAIGTAAPYVQAKAPEQTGAGDYRPSGPDAVQVDAGDPAHCPSADLTGRRRHGGRCDAGPYELGR